MLRDSKFPMFNTPPHPISSSPIDTNPTIDYDGEEYDIEGLDNVEDELQKRHLGSIQRHILGVQKFRCPICFGTSYTDSYICSFGRRYLLDASNHFEFKTEGVEIDLNSVPHSFILSGKEQHITWTVSFPARFTKISSIRLLNGFKPAQNLQALYRKTKTTDEWQPLTVTNLVSLQGTETVLDIKVEVIDPDINTIHKFTHVEIIYETVELPKAQIPQLNRSNTLFSAEDIISTEAEIDPKVGYIRKESVLEVVEQGSLWKIGSITNNTTADSRLFGYRLDMTLVHESEQISLLKLGHSANIHVSYAGLESRQGMGVI